MCVRKHVVKHSYAVMCHFSETGNFVPRTKRIINKRIPGRRTGVISIGAGNTSKVSPVLVRSEVCDNTPADQLAAQARVGLCGLPLNREQIRHAYYSEKCLCISEKGIGLP